LNKPGEAQELVQRVLNMATQNNENPDIRDRAYVYWRLLSSSPQAAKVRLKVNLKIGCSFGRENAHTYGYKGC
jgi:vesicle coat complex subunit